MSLAQLPTWLGTESRELPSMVDGRAEKKGPGSRSWGPKRAGTEARTGTAAGLWRQDLPGRECWRCDR